MATRAEAINYLRGIKGMKEGDNAVFTYELILDGGRSQLVFLWVHDDFIILTSPFATKDDITSSKALDMAVIFGVSEIAGYYGLRHLLLLDDLDESEITGGIALLGIRADALESQLGVDKL